MSLEIWLSFVLVALVAVLSPGPAVLLAVSQSSQFGVRRAAFAIFGNISGLALLTMASAVGVGSLLSASSDWFMVLRIAGGLYLIYLGLKLILNARASGTDAVQPLARMPSRRRTYSQGVLVALSNPKALLFIGALFPQFLDIGQPVWAQLAILGATLMVMSFFALMMYAVVSKSLIQKGRRAVYGKVNKITGGLFVLFGIALAAGSR